MSSASIEKVAGITVLIIILVLILFWAYGPNGSFDKAKDSSREIKNFIDYGSSETPGEKPGIPSSHEKVINQLKDTIKMMHNAKDQYCFARYNQRLGGSGFPDLAEKGTSLVLSYGKNKEGKEGTSIVVLGGVGGKQEVSYDFIEGVKPCVIAGWGWDDKAKKSQDITRNFYTSFISESWEDIENPTVLSWEEKKQRLQTIPYHFRPVEILSITWASGLEDEDGNSINVPEFPADIVSDNGNNLLDAGIIYTPDNKHICFFPTTSGDPFCSGDDQDGLDDDCLGADYDRNEEGNIAIQLDRALLQACYAKSS